MTLQAQVDKLNDKVTSIHDAMGIIQEQTKQVYFNNNLLFLFDIFVLCFVL
jgi:hypothetical protein